MSGIILSASVRRNLESLALTAALLCAASPALAQDNVTTIHGGQILSDIVAWGATAFGGAISLFLTGWTYRLMKKMGIDVTQQQRDMLQQIVVNGVNDAAAKAQSSLRGDAKLDVNAQSRVVSDAIKYVQAHGADTITALGLDPKSGAAVEAIRARIATAVADPKTPTDPVVTPTAVGMSAR